MTIKREWYNAYPPKDNIITINIGKLQEPKHRERYRKEVENILNNTINNNNLPQENGIMLCPYASKQQKKYWEKRQDKKE